MEDFVTLNAAKKLADKGFDKPCINAINCFGCTYLNGWCEYLDNRTGEFITQCDLKEGDYLLPTINQTLKWLREEKKIHIAIDITNYGFISSTISFKWDKSYCECDIEHYDHEGYSTYEEAALVEIDYILDNLI